MFIGAPGMQRPVSIDKGTALLTHIVKVQIIAGQMRLDHGESTPANGGHPDALAERARDFSGNRKGANCTIILRSCSPARWRRA
jgi:hypothetical protein